MAETLIRFLMGSLPSPRLALTLGPPLLAWAVVAAAAAGWLRQSRGVRTPYTRKIFHFAIFTTSSVLQLRHGLPAVMLFGVLVSLVVLYGVWRGEGFAFYEALARPTDAPRRTLFVIVPLVTTALGGVLANLFFGPTFAPVGYMVGGWGDAVGEPVGTRFGRHRYKVPSLAGVPATRSLEGSAAVLVMGVLAAMLALVLGGVPAEQAVKVGALCGVAGAAVEAFSSHGLDNLTVQLAAAGTAWALLG
jgi:phytol kinase